jgi:hypothetical protein
VKGAIMSVLEHTDPDDLEDNHQQKQPAQTAAAFREQDIHGQEQGNPYPPKNPQRALTIRDTEATNFLDPNLYIQLKALASDFIKSKAIPSVWASAEQVLVGLQTGAEMGMKPMEAMNSLYPVNGAINVWGKATTRRLREHGYEIKYTDETQLSCTAIVTKRVNGKVAERYEETFKFEEAVESGYTGPLSNLKVGWKPGMNRRKKLRYGVLSLIISTYIPDVLGSAMGIVEVSDDFDLGTNTSPKQIERKEQIAAAEKKHKELTTGNFKPGAISPTISKKEVRNFDNGADSQGDRSAVSAEATNG